MVKVGLVILGTLLLIGTFYVAEIMITPQQKQQLDLIKQLCNINIYGIPLGQIGQALSPNLADQCEQVRITSLVMTWSWAGYVVGFILLVLGLALGGSKTIIREVIREPQTFYEKEYEEEPKIIKKSDKKMKKETVSFCSNCGKKLSGDEEFCSNCGEKI